MDAAVSANVAEIRRRIEAAASRVGRSAAEVRLMAVTKTVAEERIREAVGTGIGMLGENYVQEAKRKIDALGQVAEWHLIGHLQTNKVKDAVKLFDMIHTIDRLEVAKDLDRRCAAIGRTMKILIEVNISGEITKRGMAPPGVLPLIRQLAAMKNLSVQGLMTMAPWVDDPEEARPCFRALRQLRDCIREADIPGIIMAELSMGMSEDYDIAVEEGATIVRIGRSIFGERPRPSA